MYEWMNLAVCRDEDPEDFFPEPWNTTGARKAIAACERCPVIAECHTYRRAVDAHSGIWHGQWFRPPIPRAEALRQEALTRVAQGATVQEIASDLEVTVGRIEGWLKRVRKSVALTSGGTHD